MANPNANAKTSNDQNYAIEVSNGQLTITININETEVAVRPSSTGKMLLVSTTRGYVPVPGTPLRLSLNLGRRP